ncbi:MAG: NAD(P)/FAD-dependent oxidoreductase [Veillonellales bacterium]
MDSVDSIVIGAGVIGLAVAGELAKRWPDKSILVAEQEEKFGQGLSSRTSEVIHSGVYYAAGSLKARLCVTGSRLLYDFCQQWQVPYQRLGKLIIARDKQDLAALAGLQQQAYANGIRDVIRLDSADIQALEPHIHAEAALFSPSSGIIDSHKLMARLEQNDRQGGVMFAYHQQVSRIVPIESAYNVYFHGPDGGEESIRCRCLINSAGLLSDKIAAMQGIDVDQAGYRIYRCKGEYFAVHNEKAGWVSHLVFPVAIRELKGSGIPVIKAMDGRLRLGPDAHYAPAGFTNYNVNPANAAQFLSVVKPYLPFLAAADLQADMAGLRPRLLVPCGSPPRDFVICHETERGLAGIVNLLGIESPGMTCCFSIAAMVADLIQPKMNNCNGFGNF